MRFFTTIFFFLLPSVLHAALQWDALSYNLKASTTDTSANVVFSFKNTGDDLVVIDEIKSSCGCTTAELSQRKYKGGEAGEIKVKFNFGDRVGPQHKTVSVRYSEKGKTTLVPLELFVDIPETISVNPRVQYWHLKGKAEARPVVITLSEDYEGRPVKAEMYADPDRSNFDVSPIGKTDDGKYMFTLTPKTTDIALTEAGDIVFEIPGKEPKKVLFYASVRP